MTLLNNPVGQLIPLFYTQSTIAVTLDEPDPGDTVTDAEILIEWSFVGTQVSYNVQVFSDADADNLVYTSGVVVSATKSHAIPAGSLENLTDYWVVVSVVASDGTSGETDLVDFSTSFAPSTSVPNVRTRANDLCSDALDAPYVEVTWDQVVPGGGETFVEYRVQRRAPGETTWTTLAVIDAIGTLRYRDRLPQSYTGYAYAVIWVASAGGDTLISSPEEPYATAQVRFDYAWIQPVDDPDSIVRIDSFDSDVQTVMDTVLSVTAGRRAPTAFVGEPLYHVVIMPPSPRLASDSQWRSFEEFLESQREGATFCLRLGKQRLRFFGVFTSPRRGNQQKTYGIGFTFTETHYVEGVSA